MTCHTRSDHTNLGNQSWFKGEDRSVGAICSVLKS